jgi:hypothetical protein
MYDSRDVCPGEFQDYWRDLQWAPSYAIKNCEIMMAQVMKAVGKVMLSDGNAPVE